MRGGEQPVALPIERQGADLPERLIVEIGEPGVDLKIVEHGENFARGLRQNGEAHVGMLLAEGRRQLRRHAERGRHGGDGQMADEGGLWRADFLAHRAGVADDALGPFQHALAIGGEAVKARAAIDEQDAEAVLELLYAGRQRRLGDAAAFRGAAEIALARESQQKFELVDHGAAPRCAARSAAARLAKAVMKAAWLQARFLAEVCAPVVRSNCSERSPLSPA